MMEKIIKYFMCTISAFLMCCTDAENKYSEKSEKLGGKADVEGYMLGTRALSDQIKDVTMYYLPKGQTTNYSTYPLTNSSLSWLGEYFLFETDKWRTDINCGIYTDTVYYYMTGTNETGNEEGPEPLHGIAPMYGEPIAEFYLRCRKSKLTTIVKMADGSMIDPSLISLTLNVYPEEISTDFKSPAIMGDKTQLMITHTLISPTSGADVKSISKTLLLPEQIFEKSDAERPTMLLEYDDTKYYVYLDTIAIDRAVTNRYREKYNGFFALLHNEHITLTLSLTPIIEMVASVTLDDWIPGKSYEPIAVNPTEPIIFKNGVFEIYTGQGLAIFRDIVNGTNTTAVSGIGGVPNDIQTAQAQLQNNVNIYDYTNWAPIGNTTKPYKGMFNGQNHTITNLKITSGDNCGLFGVIENATIGNLRLKNAKIEGGTVIGALCGKASDSKITCCGVSDCVLTGSGNELGGLVGEASEINGCYVKNSIIKGENNVGGLAGNVKNVYCSYVSESTVSGEQIVGGLVGGNDGQISYCYTSDITLTGSSNVFYLTAANAGSSDYCATKNQNEVPGFSGTNTNCDEGVFDNLIYYKVAIDIETLVLPEVEMGIPATMYNPVRGVWNQLDTPPTLWWE